MSTRKGRVAYVIDNLVARTVAYYIVLFAAAAGLGRIPAVKVLMRGSIDQLLGETGFSKKEVLMTGANAVPITETTLAMTVAAAMLGAVLLALPTAWIYTLTRQKKGFQQSVVQTLMVLPPLVAGVVVLVKYSLALAFSLAGIVAAVRFRNTLEDSKDAVYIFLATAIGLAAAVQLPVAAVISVLFNLLNYVLWYTDFGKPVAFEGERAKQRMEETRQRMRQTGSFNVMLDRQIFQNMNADQLDIAADALFRQRRKLRSDEGLDDDEMQGKPFLLRIRTSEPGGSRAVIEAVFDEFLKNPQYVGVTHEKDGTHYVEYRAQLKKGARSEDLESALNAKSEVLAVEFK